MPRYQQQLSQEAINIKKKLMITYIYIYISI